MIETNDATLKKKKKKNLSPAKHYTKQCNLLDVKIRTQFMA